MASCAFLLDNCKQSIEVDEMKQSAMREVSNSREHLLLQLTDQPTQEVVGSGSEAQQQVIQAQQEQAQGLPQNTALQPSKPTEPAPEQSNPR
mmetsp:Transcript_37213/g.76274  ORF Transcript_37213/g.76274 Transcript_37213/m.76274 type:complete len:92 (+) Transcript_37213:2-277(+)